MAASDEDIEPAVWVGGWIETPQYTLTIPDDWVAVQPGGHPSRAADAILARIEQGPGECNSQCAFQLRYWVSELEDGPLELLGPFGRLNDGLLNETAQCEVGGPESLSGRTLEELAHLGFEAYAQSDLVEASDSPHALSMGGSEVWRYDYSMAAHDLEGAIYLYGNGEQFARLACHGRPRPADDWLELAETFRMTPAAGDSIASGNGASDLQAMLPLWVGGQSMATHAHQGLDYLRNWSRMPEDELRKLENDPGSLSRLTGLEVELEDFLFAMAGRSDTADPANFVTALWVRGIPARMLPLSMVVSHPEAGPWVETTYGTRTVQVGTEAMLDPAACCGGRPYVYDVGEVRFTVYTDDEEWAAEAIARLRPDPITEDAAALVDLYETWQPGYNPTVVETIEANAREAGVRFAAHDAERIGQQYVPTLEAYYSQVRLDEDVPATLDRWAATYPLDRARGRSINDIERITLPSGEALRVEMIGTPRGFDWDVAEVRYLIVTPAGVFDLLFSMKADELADYEVAIHDMAGSLLRDEPDPDGLMARLAREEISRTDVELMLGGFRSHAPEPTAASGFERGPVIRGGRLEIPAKGFALEAPEGWYAIDVTHPQAAHEMRGFDATTRTLLEGGLLPKNALLRGAFASSTQAGHLTAPAIAQLLEPAPFGVFALIALAPPDVVDGQHECVVYVWETDAQTAESEAEDSLSGIRADDPEADLRSIDLPAGEAAVISASSGSWEFAIFTLLQDGLAYNLECGHYTRHDELWQDIAESFEFLDE